MENIFLLPQLTVQGMINIQAPTHFYDDIWVRLKMQGPEQTPEHTAFQTPEQGSVPGPEQTPVHQGPVPGPGTVAVPGSWTMVRSRVRNKDAFQGLEQWPFQGL
jgi:hypothetical protein